LRRCFSSVQLRESSNWCRSYAVSVLVPISRCIGRIEKIVALATFCPSPQRTCSSGTASTATAVDPVCSSSLSCRRNELQSSSTKLQPSAVAQVCSSSDQQELPLHGTESTATAVDQVCSSPGHPRSPSNPVLCGLYTASNPILCVATQAHHPNSIALQSEPTTATQFPQLASNSNTLHTIFGTSDLRVTPKYHLLIQLRAVDRPPIYPCSIPKYFLPWQFLLPTPSPAFPLEPDPLQPRSEPLKHPGMQQLTPCPPTAEAASLAILVL